MALVSRGIFLFIVVPHLVAGELTDYVFMTTIALLSARFLTMGMEEQLPLAIAGRRNVAEFFSPLVSLMIVIEIFVGLVFVLSSGVVLSAALLASSYVTTSLFAGLLRSVNVSAAERLRDLHWIIFSSVCLLPFSWDAGQLMGLLSISLMCIHLLELRICKISIKLNLFNWGEVWAQCRKQIRSAWKKLIGSYTVVAIVRGIVLWATVLGHGFDLDNIAYALLLGEAFLQTAMVLVYRRYASYCGTLSENYPQMKKNALYAILILMAYASIAASFAYVLEFLGVIIGRFADWKDVALIFSFFGMVSCYLLLRYLTWVVKDFDWVLVCLEIFLILAEGFLVVTTDQSDWVVGLLVIASGFLFFTIGYVLLVVKPGSVNHRTYIGRWTD